MSAESRQKIEALLRADASPAPCVAIHKNATRADVTRSRNRSASWSIERPEPWAAHLMSGETLSSTDITLINGIPFYFAVLEPERMPVLELFVVNDGLHVQIAN